jgi:copper(I)-binding protein
MRTRIITILPILLTILFGFAAHAGSALVFENVWIAEAPPVSKVLAAYMDIKNTSDKDQKLISAKSGDFGSIEFHRTVEKDGMASMQHQEYLLVPAGGTLTLKPGDYHMMLFRPARKLRAGDESSIQFQLADDTQVTVTATVKKASAEDSHEHHHHH